MAMEHSYVDSTPASESPRSFPTPFLSKTYHLVDHHTFNDVISWNHAGSSFIVWNPVVFAKDLLPLYFKHNNFSTFVRQLNTYGFRKVVPDRWEFSNECFRRGAKRLLCQIRRRKGLLPVPSPPLASAAGATTIVTFPFPLSNTPIPSAKQIATTSNSGDEVVISSKSPSPSLLEENERLRRENVKLKKELAEMRSLCNNILTLMSSYANAQRMDSKPLSLMPEKQFYGEDAAEDMNTKLFGVAIGAKRVRKGTVEDTASRLHQPFDANVKSEPLDYQSQHENQEMTWLKQCQIANERAYD
ncbi:hypothetical protein RIF29_23703 [Crotalaria pallida]|uniref:HSF-type DNA-binding domain-containing protein n=1 Tax=Crotalaria pallida TaxID=3830 RepID=A0AAN9FB14_CROPI